MRILIITETSGYMPGGVPAETRRLVTGLVQNGHEVSLASDVPLGDETKLSHIPIKIPAKPALANDIRHAIDIFKPDFVHVMCMSLKGIMILAPVLHAHPWALTVHSVPPYERKLSRWHGGERLHYFARSLRFALNGLAWRWIFSRGIVPMSIVHSKFVEDIVLRYGASRDFVRSIPLCFHSTISQRVVDTSPVNTDAPLLVTVAGFAHTKGQHDVVKALPALLGKFPRLRYQIIGEVRDESYVSYLRRLCQDLRVLDHFLITPNLDNAAKQKVLEQADVYIQPSHEEGFCLAYAEAAAIVPRLVGTNTGAIAAISDGDAGARVIPAKAPAAIVSAVTELMTADLPPLIMRERDKRLSERFSIAGYLRSHEELYALLSRQVRTEP
jgi:glycosyltransferase involved in cell wall biosynthesis